MKPLMTHDKHPFLSAGIVFFCFVYMFFYQLNYPFNPAYFLYVIFGLSLVLLFLFRILRIDSQIWSFLLCVLISVIGLLYTSNSEEGQRETLILLVMIVFLLANLSSRNLNLKLKKSVLFGACMVLCGIYLQFVFGETFNSWMQGLLRNDCYRQLIWSFRRDHAYAGFSAYTVDAAFFAAILFGRYTTQLLGYHTLKSRRGLRNTVLVVLSLYAVFLTSKRGIFVGMILALFISMVLLRKISRNASVKIGGTLLCLAIGMVILYFSSEAARNFLNRFLGEGDLTTGRAAMYATALSRILNGNFFTGFGTGATYSLFSSGMHNIYLQILYDHGMIGVTLYLLFFGYNLKRACSANDVQAVYIQLLMLIYGLSGNPIYSNMIFMTYLIYSTYPRQTVAAEKHEPAAEEPVDRTGEFS